MRTSSCSPATPAGFAGQLASSARSQSRFVACIARRPDSAHNARHPFQAAKHSTGAEPSAIPRKDVDTMHPIREPSTVDTDAGAPFELTPAAVMRGAALYLHRHGWHQGDLFADEQTITPPACLLGAIRMAACGGVTVLYTDATSALVESTIYHLADWLRDSTNGDIPAHTLVA